MGCAHHFLAIRDIWVGTAHPTKLLDEKGKKTAVLIPIDEYEEMIEDMCDLALIAERRDEPVVSFDEVKKRLKADGLI